MKLPGTIFLLIVLCMYCHAEDLLFFTDDYYKALGSPRLDASVINPILQPEEAVLRIALANNGRVEELMPIKSNGSAEDRELEMGEEMHIADAFSVTAALYGSGPVQVISGPQNIADLPAGSRKEMRFNLSLQDGSSGWHDLLLLTEYEHQVDVSVSDGAVLPLYQPDNDSKSLRIFIAGSESALKVLGTDSSLVPGGSGALMAVIKNVGQKPLKNCSALLMASPPFHISGGQHPLGDLPPGGFGVASFFISVDGNATLHEYQLVCQVGHDDGREILSLPVTLTGSPPNTWRMLLIVAIILIAAMAAYQVMRNRRHLRRRRL
jgi:hypothetical protein